MELQHILVVIEADAESQPALERARQVAKLADCRLELIIADHTPYLEDGFYFEPVRAQELRQQHGEQRLQELEAIADPLREQGLEVSCVTAWGNPTYQELVSRIEETQPSLVIKATRHHNKVSRLLLSNEDWQLVRHCSAPLLLVKTDPWPVDPKFLVAVDPYHIHDKPASLDNRLIAAAQSLANFAQGEVHLFHSDWIPPLAGVYSLVHDRELDQKVLEAMAQSNDVPVENCHWSDKEISDSLPAAAEATSASVVVMGSMSRSRLDELLVGNTAERVLDSLDCDVLLLSAGKSES